MTDVCNFYKPSEYRCGDKTCTNSAMCYTKYCPFVKDGKFKNKKAAEACKGYAALTPDGIAGIYKEGCTQSGKVYVRFFEADSRIVAELVDHKGNHYVGGYLFNLYKRTGILSRAQSINPRVGLSLDCYGKLPLA